MMNRETHGIPLPARLANTVSERFIVSVPVEGMNNALLVLRQKHVRDISNRYIRAIGGTAKGMEAGLSFLGSGPVKEQWLEAGHRSWGSTRAADLRMAREVMLSAVADMRAADPPSGMDQERYARWVCLTAIDVLGHQTGKGYSESYRATVAETGETLLEASGLARSDVCAKEIVDRLRSGNLKPDKRRQGTLVQQQTFSQLLRDLMDHPTSPQHPSHPLAA